MKWLGFLSVFIVYGSCAQSSWTWMYSKLFRESERLSFASKRVASFVQCDTPRFTQLILSWNAVRPSKGFLRFFVQARDAYTKTWCKEHHMVDWGNGSRTYLSDQDTGSAAHHVRLEMNRRFADAFRIRVEARNGADLSTMHGLFASVSDIKSMQEHDFNRIKQLPAVVISGVPCFSQMILEHPRAPHLCSPTSLSMLLSFLQQKEVHPLAVASQVYDPGLDAYGSWPFNAAYAYEACGGKMAFYVQRLDSFVDLHKQLMRGFPVMVSVRGQIDGGAKVYNNGHLVLVVGFDAEQQKVLCHDPAFDAHAKVAVAYNCNSFISAWDRSHRLAYGIGAAQ